MDLTGRKVLVTGASSGLGRATAILLSRLGANILLVARNADRLQEILVQLDGTGHRAAGFDLNEAEKIPAFIAEQAKDFGCFSGIVHSAGTFQVKPLRVCRPQDFESLYRIHVIAASQLLRGLTQRDVVAAGGCSMVILGSIASVSGSPGISAYSSAKAAVLGLVRTAALELAGDRIRVNAVLPGHCDTPMTTTANQLRTAEQIRRMEEDQPLGLGRPEDVANAVAFLLADTGRWMTGSCMMVDGGFSAH